MDPAVPPVDKLKQRRQDPTRAATLRFLILRSLAELGYLPSNQKRALGLGPPHSPAPTVDT